MKVRLIITPQENHLSDKRYVTVIVRMVIDRRERLVHGEVVDVDGKAQGRFDGWREMIHTVRGYLTHRQC